MSNDTHALVMENKGQSISQVSFGQNKLSVRSKSREKIKCYHCGKPGHMKRNCKFLKQGVDKSQNQEDDMNTIATTSSSDDEVTLLYNQEDCCHVADEDVEWVVDSTASYHIVPKRKYFSTYKLGDFGFVKMENKSVTQIVEIGDICIQTSMGCILTLKYV